MSAQVTNEIRINDKISYIPATANPLSSDVGIVRDGGATILFDVGFGPHILGHIPKDADIVVLSHFHLDHTGNLELVPAKDIYCSKETSRHITRGTVIKDELTIGNVRIFRLPSSHAKGCLGLEIDNEYAFVGDALYYGVKNGERYYNEQLLREEIDIIENLSAEYLLVSHYAGMIRKKDAVISELKTLLSCKAPDRGV